MFVSILLFLIATILLGYGLSYFSKNPPPETVESYTDFDPSMIVPIIALITGGLFFLTSILGCLSAKCKNCLCTFPFVVITFVLFIFVLMAALVTSGLSPAGYKEIAFERACHTEIKDG